MLMPQILEPTQVKTIDKKYVNPFIISAIDIIKEVAGLNSQRKKVFVQQGKATKGGLAIIMDIHGHVKGKVIYEFSKGMTLRLASKMIEQSKVSFNSQEEAQRLLQSAIIELGNLISGKAITILEVDGVNCNIKPPSLSYGRGNNIIPFSKHTIVIEMSTIFGDFNINLAIEI